MNVIYTDKMRQSGEAYELVRQASQRLPEVVDPTANAVTAEWDRTDDEKGRPRYTLRLNDDKSDASVAFDLEQLRNTPDVRFHLLHLWGELIQAENHRLLRNLQALSAGD